MAKGTLLSSSRSRTTRTTGPARTSGSSCRTAATRTTKGLRRHISLVTSPTEHGVVGLATRLRDTAFKRTLAELEVGDEVEVEEPKGRSCCREDTSATYVFVAGGIGITVFRSMLRYVADESLPYRITLVYSNRDRESAAFLDELEQLERRIDGLRVVLTMTDEEGWEGETRRPRRGRSRRARRAASSDKTIFVAGAARDGRGASASRSSPRAPDDRVVAGKFSRLLEVRRARSRAT